jgi:hypothetical protein
VHSAKPEALNAQSPLSIDWGGVELFISRWHYASASNL